jgi:hypothetical protein
MSHPTIKQALDVAALAVCVAAPERKCTAPCFNCRKVSAAATVAFLKHLDIELVEFAEYVKCDGERFAYMTHTQLLAAVRRAAGGGE